MFSKVKGVADNFFEMSYWSGVRKKIEAHLKRYNFFEIEIPILEHVALFQRSLGLDTDVVSKEMFIIQNKSDKADSEQICLRPEATAGTMRAFLEVQSQAVTPCKVFCCGAMFRYERPQKGRWRQFHQMNMEMIGGASILYDAHYLKMLHVLFVEVFAIESAVLKLNFLGEAAERKVFGDALVAFVKQHQEHVCQDCITRIATNPLRMLDCKIERCQAVYKNAPKLSDFFSNQTAEEWKILQETLHELGVSFVIDHQLVRGLDYYNKTVFEFASVDLGAQSAFCGGGRYDGLAEQLGSKVKIPAFGCAIGMGRLLLLLEKQKDHLSEKPAALSCIIPIDIAQNKVALHLVDFLQAHGKAVDVLLDDQKIQTKMKKANQMKAQFALIIGEDEQKNNTIIVKNMVTGVQQVCVQSDVYKYV